MGDGPRAKRQRSKSGEERNLLERLDLLEGQLQTLKRQLETTQRSSGLPAGDFRALIFQVGGGTYAAPLDAIREIVRYVELTPVADVPAVVCGALNLRGEVLPVIDARLRLGQPAPPPNLRTTIVVLSSAQTSFGLVVDAVDAVSTIEHKEVAQPRGDITRGSCVAGVVTLAERVVQLLDVELLLSVNQWTAVLHQLAAESAESAPLEAEA